MGDDEQKNSDKKDGEEKANSQKEGDIPFKELLEIKKMRTLESDTQEYEKKKEKYGDEVPAYDPYLTSSPGSTYKEPPIAKPKQPENNTSQILNKKPYRPQPKAPEPQIKVAEEPLKEQKIHTPYPGANSPQKDEADSKIQKDQKQGGPEEKDEETVLREEFANLSKEHSEWKQKIEYYQSKQKNILEEKEDFLIKKEGVEKVLNPILEEEKRVEKEIKDIEKESEEILSDDKKREKERERWQKEDKRQELEKKKWTHTQDLQTILKMIEEKGNTYDILKSKEKEAEKRLEEIERQKSEKETRLHLLEVRRLKKDIEENKSKLASQVRSMEETVDHLAKSEENVIQEKRDIESKESQAENPEEEKTLEAKRWDVESRLRKIEKERWQVEDKLKELLEMMADIADQYNKILRQEREALAKLEENNQENKENE